jgi:hypothetical protein
LSGGSLEHLRHELKDRAFKVRLVDKPAEGFISDLVSELARMVRIDFFFLPFAQNAGPQRRMGKQCQDVGEPEQTRVSTPNCPQFLNDPMS